MTPAEQHLIPWLRTESPAPADLPVSSAGWLQLADTCVRTGFAGLLLERARQIGTELPSEVYEKLHAASRAVAANNLHLTSELTRILEALQRAGVPVMLLKGAALIPTIYRNLQLRPMSDLDLLVPPDDVPKALTALSAVGCQFGQALVRDDFFPRYYYEIELHTGAPRPARIDLHARPFRPLRFARTMPDDALWENRVAIRVGEAEASVPRPELMFLHLAVHAAVHGFSRLLWLYDLRRFVDHHGKSMDWALLINRARRWRLSLPLSRAIRRTAALLGPVAPDRVVEELAVHRATWRDRLALGHAPRDAGNPVAQILVNLLTTPGYGFRIGYVKSLLFPGPKHLAHIYPHRHRGWTFLAHGLRFLRAAGRLAATVGYVAMRGLAGPPARFLNNRVKLARPS